MQHKVQSVPNLFVYKSQILTQGDTRPIGFMVLRTYQRSTDNMIEKHVFGVPTMIADDHMWWGNDRIMLLEKYLLNQAALRVS